MYKVLWFLRRKAGITHEQFHDHYENSHSVLARKHLGHLMLAYRRNYRTEVWGGGVIADGGSGFGPREWDYDVVAEWVMPDEAAFNAIMALFSDPVVGKIFYEDEEHFLDRESIMLIKCDCRDTGTDSPVAG